MKTNNIEINILIKGQTPATEFRSPQDGRTYVEGREGSDFEIEVVNNNPYRVEAILSVDGLSVIDGKAAGQDSVGYVVGANATVRIPGWKVDSATAAKFVFTGKKGKGGSYVEAIGGDDANKGVIGAMVFKDRDYRQNTMVRSFGMGMARGMIPKGFATTCASAATMWASNAGSGLNADSVDGMQSALMMNISTPVGATLSASAAAQPDTLSLACAMPEPVEQTLGTGFGDAADFKTKDVEFRRGDMAATIVLFYDDRKGLEKRGIDISRVRIKPTPNPFPGTGCPIPDGWSR